ncbi:hypothetical protein [Deinococcus navajonensis]|uniref:Uncharacterized protein n=1 Tax=Deinococcus navajonensis TaxID=309884 RepID=A0ABV8XP16_9DEIO
MFKLFRRAQPAGDPEARALVRQDDPQTFRVRVRTRPHAEIVELRFTKSAHIGADDNGYVLRKAVVSPRHFDRGEVLIRFDSRYRVTATETQGLDLIPVAEWTE